MRYCVSRSINLFIQKITKEFKAEAFRNIHREATDESFNQGFNGSLQLV